MATQYELTEALHRVASMTGGKGDHFAILNRKASVDMLSAAITELMDLRAASIEVICKSCKLITTNRKNVKCKECGDFLHSLSHVQMEAMRAKVADLEEQVARLSEVISVAFDLDKQEA